MKRQSCDKMWKKNAPQKGKKKENELNRTKRTKCKRSIVPWRVSTQKHICFVRNTIIDFISKLNCTDLSLTVDRNKIKKKKWQRRVAINVEQNVNNWHNYGSWKLFTSQLMQHRFEIVIINSLSDLRFRVDLSHFQLNYISFGLLFACNFHIDFFLLRFDWNALFSVSLLSSICL